MTLRQAHRASYISWRNMRYRCRNPGNRQYHNYGGRGITVCKRWLKFKNFLADMGDRPNGLTLERKDNNRGYSKSNCRWATYKEQNGNRSDYNLRSPDGRLWKDVAAKHGVCKQTLRARVRRLGWSWERAATTPPRKS